MQISIDTLIYGGLSLARTTQGVVFVEGGIPGEELEVEVYSKLKGTPLAKIKKILTPSAERRIPKCKGASSCGGCQWQHITYEAQLKAKDLIARDCFQRIAKLTSLPEIELFTSPEWAYRRRVQLQRNDNEIGFYKRKSHEVIPLTHCPILSDEINLFLESQKEWLPELSADVKQLKLLSGESLAIYPKLKNYCSKTQIKLSELSFEVKGNSFFQNNQYLSDNLGQWAKGDVGGNYMVDLFGGVGFFSLMLADKFKEVLLIEKERAQVDMALSNFILNGYSHLKAQAKSAEKFFKEMKAKRKLIDLLVVDPPRGGLSEKVRHGMKGLTSTQVLYISCNPTTMARDLAEISSWEMYDISKIALFDLYPQTYHMEMAALLTLK
ncbi:MAG: class I SAM-dependent RNA methyltransferase [Planctomycetes bacterium]|nr:class I SAM-dependent RNA methyltransferase [Planctomycetota bacterium]